VPDAVVACVGGGSNAAGIFAGFTDSSARLVGVQPEGGAAIGHGVPGVVHGSKSMLLQDEDGQVTEASSVSAGLDYPGVGPEHAYLAESGRASYRPVTDAEAMDAFALLSKTEGIIPAIESAHAVAGALEVAKEAPGSTILVNLSGRGDKDMGTAIEWFGLGETRADDATGEPSA
jgi:tryptophan synthase beta chain